MRANTWRILIVCEDDSQRMALRQTAEQCSLLVEEAASPEQALVFFHMAETCGQAFHLILLHGPAEGPAYNRLFDALQQTPVLMIGEKPDSQADRRGKATPGKILGIKCQPDPSGLRKAITDLLRDIPEPGLKEPSVPPEVPGVEAASILVAEDEPACRLLIVDQLRTLGYAVDVVDNGRGVIEAILDQKKLYSLVLMNGHMPDLDGFTATRILRQAELVTGQRVPIVAITANPFQSEKEAYLSAGMDAVLCKPILLDDLRQVIQTWIGSTENPDAPTTLEELPPIQPVIDSVLETIQDLQIDGEPDLVGQLVEIYLDEATDLLEKLKISVQHEEPVSVRQLARRLKTSSSNLGVQGLANLCQEIENGALMGDLAGVIRLVRQAENEYARVWQVLKARRHGVLEKKPKSLDQMRGG